MFIVRPTDVPQRAPAAFRMTDICPSSAYNLPKNSPQDQDKHPPAAASETSVSALCGLCGEGATSEEKGAWVLHGYVLGMIVRGRMTLCKHWYKGPADVPAGEAAWEQFWWDTHTSMCHWQGCVAGDYITPRCQMAYTRAALGRPLQHVHGSVWVTGYNISNHVQHTPSCHPPSPSHTQTILIFSNNNRWQTARRCQALHSGEWRRFIERILRLLPTPLPCDALSKRDPSSYRVHIWHGKTRTAGLQMVKVAWWSTQSFGHNTSTWQTYRQPRRRRHSKCRANVLRRAAKTKITQYKKSKRYMI